MQKNTVLMFYFDLILYLQKFKELVFCSFSDLPIINILLHLLYYVFFPEPLESTLLTSCLSI